MLPSTQEIGYEANEISWPAADGGMLVKNRLETLDGKGRGMDRGMADSGTFRGPRGGACLVYYAQYNLPYPHSIYQ